MKLLVIRHTSVGVPPGLCYGWSDVPLAAGSSDEFSLVKQRLEGHSFDAIWSSPLTRCRQLGEYLADGNHSVQTDARLKELNFGRFEGRFWEEISRTREAETFFADFVSQPCPDGESFSDVLQRVNDFLDDLEKSGHHKVLILTHGGVVRALLSIINGVNPADVFNYQVDYGQLIEFEWKGNLK